METLKKIAFIVFLVALASCSKNYPIVGSWVQVQSQNDKKDVVTLIETFSEDGTYKGEISLQSGELGLGGKGITNGSYDIIGDSIFIYHNSVTILGQETPIKGNVRIGRKIIQLDDEKFVFAIEGKKTEMTRMESSEEK